MTNFEQELNEIELNFELLNTYKAGDILNLQLSQFPEAKQALLKLHREEVEKALLKLKEEMKMHTVPEGQDLITRHYLENSIEFMIARLKGGRL